METTKSEILDFSKVTLPTDFSLLKIVTYNIQLKNSISLDSHINRIVGYIFNRFRNKDIDIICLQGLNDRYTAHVLITSIKKVALNKKQELYYAPSYDHINISNKTDITNSFQMSWINNQSAGGKDILQKHSTNIIISKHKIVNYIFNELNRQSDSTINSNDIIAANIDYKGSILSIYNISLCEDFSNAKISGKSCRDIELDIVSKIILANKHEIMTNKRFKKFYRPDINFLVGNFAIAEKEGDDITEEYNDVTQMFKAVDIYRLVNDGYAGFTNKNKKRVDYMMLLLSEDIFDPNSEFYQLLMQMQEPKDLLNIVFKKYNIHILQSLVNTTMDFRSNFPVENIMMIK